MVPLDIFDLSSQLFTAYLLVCARMFGLYTTLPLFGERTVPWQVKAGLSCLTAFCLLPLAQTDGLLPDRNLLALGFGVAKEMLIGVIIGYLARLLFGAFQFALNAIDFQTGLSFVQLVNPAADTRMSVLGQFLNSLMLLLFLEVNGHHILIRTVAKSLAWAPLGVTMPQQDMLSVVVVLFTEFVIISFQLALPTVLILLLIDFAFGIIGKMVPQVHVFLIALPVKIMVGLLTVALTMPVITPLLERLLGMLAADAATIARMFG